MFLFTLSLANIINYFQITKYLEYILGFVFIDKYPI